MPFQPAPVTAWDPSEDRDEHEGRTVLTPVSQPSYRCLRTRYIVGEPGYLLFVPEHSHQ